MAVSAAGNLRIGLTVNKEILLTGRGGDLRKNIFAKSINDEMETLFDNHFSCEV